MSRANTKAAWICGALIFLGALGVNAGESLRMQVSPMVAFAPASLHIYVGIDRRADNRLLRITAESAEFYRSSDIQLDGEYSPRAMVVMFRDVPAGSYEVRAELVVSGGKTSSVERRSVIVN